MKNTSTYLIKTNLKFIEIISNIKKLEKKIGIKITDNQKFIEYSHHYLLNI